MPDNDKLWHASFKPYFTQTNQLIYKSNGADDSDIAWNTELLVESPSSNVVLTSLQGRPENVSHRVFFKFLDLSKLL